MPAELVDPAALARAFAGHPGAAFAFVRDRVAWEPYAGTLRGTGGTLESRGGSSLDRSLLLAQLLAATEGTDVRIARGRLAPDAARALLDGAFGPAPRVPLARRHPAAKLVRVFDQAVTRAARASGLDRARIEQGLERAIAGEQRLEDAVRRRADRTMATLDAALARANVESEADLARMEARLVEAASDHFWVQARGAAVQALGAQPGPDGFVDLDPSQPEPGRALRPAESTFGAGAVPAGLVWRLTVVLHAVREVHRSGGLFGGGVSRDDVELLRHATTLAEAGAEQIRLALLPDTEAFRAAASAPEPQAAAIATAIGSADRFRVSLRAGDRSIAAKSIDASGAQTGVANPVGGLGSAAVGLFGGQGAGSARLVELAIEIRLSGPGGTRTERRTLARSAADLRAAHAVTLHSIAWETSLAAELARHERTIRAVHDAFEHLRAERVEGDLTPAARAVRDLRTLAGVVSPVSAEVARLRSIRDGLLASDRAIGWASLRRPGAPFLVGVETRVTADGGALEVERGYDFIATESFLARGGGERLQARARDVFRANLRQAALEAAAEDEALRRLLGGDDRVVSASATLERAMAQNVPIEVVRQAGEIAALAVPDSTKALVGADLRAYGLVVIPERPLQVGARSDAVGWFAIDPATGAAIGRMDTGRGQATAENISTTMTVIDVAWDSIEMIVNCPSADPRRGGPLACFAKSLCNIGLGLFFGLRGPRRPDFSMERFDAWQFWRWARGRGDRVTMNAMELRLAHLEATERYLLELAWGREIRSGLLQTGFSPAGAVSWLGDHWMLEQAGNLFGDGIVGTVLCDWIVQGGVAMVTAR